MGGRRAGDAMEPLVFGILRRLTPPEVETLLVDERVEKIDGPTSVDLVAMTVETHTALRAYQLAAGYRRLGIPVVMGGHHPTLQPEEALGHADAIVIGDAEGVWPLLLRDAQAGRLRRLYRAEAGEGALPADPDRSIFAGKPYLRLPLVQHGRGCPYGCDFCSVSAFYGGGGLCHRPAGQVAAEIARLDRRNLFFVDDNFMADRGRTEELLEALVPLRVRWTCQVSLDLAADDRMLDLMAKSGCSVALIGFESLDRRNLEQMGKGVNLAGGDYAAAVEQFRRRGIMVYGTFLFGYDHDTPAAMEAAMEFAIRNRLCLANFNPLTPFPGTPLHARLQREGRLIHERWWLDPAYRYGQALFHPRGMTATELEEGCFRARREFYRFSSILRRGADGRANGRNLSSLGLFTVGNLVSRREILLKQGSSLGGGVLPPAEGGQ